MLHETLTIYVLADLVGLETDAEQAIPEVVLLQSTLTFLWV